MAFLLDVGKTIRLQAAAVYSDFSRQPGTTLVWSTNVQGKTQFAEAAPDRSSISIVGIAAGDVTVSVTDGTRTATYPVTVVAPVMPTISSLVITAVPVPQKQYIVAPVHLQ